VVKALALLALVTACGNFQDRDIVLDLRVLAITSEPANQVVDISATSQPADVIAQLVPTTVCALASDPSFGGNLLWSMTMCNLDTDDRCTASSPQIQIGQGSIADPDTTSPEPALCATIQPNSDLVNVLVNYIQNDPLMGLGGVDYGVLLAVRDDGDQPSEDQFAAKTLQVMPRIPPDVTQNTNPTISGLTASVNDGDPAPIPLVRCADLDATGTTPLIVSPDDDVTLTPVEPDGVHEVYVVPTIDGGEQMFTEAITYQWNAGIGSFSNGSTGGPVDLFGNPPPIFTDWTAPEPSDIDGVTDVPLWIVQRDDRLGEAWFESCLRVMP
jgi:hypothetical protein